VRCFVRSLRILHSSLPSVPYCKAPPVTSFLIRDWEGCTTGTIGLPNPNQRSVVKTSGFLHPYIYLHP
jgi:hypothetical protein